MFNFARAAGLAAAAALTIGASASVSQAATIFATSVDSFIQGGGNTTGQAGIAASRSNPNNALFESDNKFVSLGIAGELIVSFGQSFVSPGAIFEITNTPREDFPESVDIFGILNGVETFIDSFSNASGLSAFTFTGVFDQLKLVDTTTLGTNTDGFDVESISVTPAPIPLPAGGLLLLTALGGVAALRRRKAA